MIDIILGIAIGAIVGGLTFAIFVAHKWDQVFRQMYCVGFIGQLNTVHRIEVGQSEELIQEIAESIPNYVTTIQNEFSSDNS